jgi:hypothetical protein
MDIFIGETFYSGTKVQRYGEIHKRLYLNEKVAENDIDYLGETGKEYYIVVWRDDLREKPYLDGKFLAQQDHFERVYENPAGRVYRLRTNQQKRDRSMP